MADERPRSPLALDFRLGPIPVRVEPSFWFVSLLFGLSGGFDVSALTWVAVVFVSILVHELGHALAALAQGASASIFLYSFGGLTVPAREKPLSRLGDIAMSLAGPFAGFAFGSAPSAGVGTHVKADDYSVGTSCQGDIGFRDTAGTAMYDINAHFVVG